MKRLAFFVLFVSLAFLAFAQDIGVSIDASGSAFSTSSDGASISLAPTLSVKSKLSQSDTFGLRLAYSASGSFDFSPGGAFSTGSFFPDAIDLQEFRIATSRPLPEQGLTSFSTVLGRFAYSDPTTAIFNYRLDGMSLGFSAIGLSIDANLGYTGLFWRSASAVSMGLSDASSTDTLGSPRLVGSLSLKLPELFDQTLLFFALAQEDLRDSADHIPLYSTAEDTSKGGPIDTQYLGANIYGFFGDFNYSGFATLGSGRVLSYLTDATSSTQHRYLFSSISSLFAGASLGFSLNPQLGIGLRFQYGTGDPDASTYWEGNSKDNVTQFISIAYASPYAVFTPAPGNITLGELSVSYSPFLRVPIGLKSVQLMSKTIVFMKTGDGPVSVPGVEAITASKLLGLEEDLTVSVRLLSDLSVNITLGYFAPAVGGTKTAIDYTKGAFDPTYEGAHPQFMLRIGASLSM